MAWKILHLLAFCVDNILVFSRNVKEHKNHLHQLLHRLQVYSLSINMSKSNVAPSEFQFVGHKITKDRIFALQERFEAINRHPLPSTVRELRQVLGLINFLWRFIEGEDSCTPNQIFA